MIKIQRKEDCCGCKACGDVCAHNSIKFKVDEEGNWYPVVNMDTCVDCGLCENVCPILHSDFSDLNNSTNPESYILQASNLNDRLESASGAAYTLIARYVFERGGYVAGHIWNGKTKVIGYVSGNPDDLDILRGTKYLQSDTEGLYKAVKSLLRENKLVLFSGCPCQVAAMRRFLRKDYGNLITTDFTCMGIDSPLAFAKYIESLEEQYGAEMVYFKAKAKDVGWTQLTNKARFANGKSYFGICSIDANLKATFQNVLVRPSCYECKFKGLPRIADITIGDYWRKWYDYDPLDDNTGTSYAILNNTKASVVFNNIKSLCYYRKVQVTDILGANPLAKKSLPRPSFSRDDFYKRLTTENFSILVEEYSNKQQHNTHIWSLRRFIRGIINQWKFSNRNFSDMFSFVKLNFFNDHIRSNYKEGCLLYVKNTNVSLSKDSRIEIKGATYVGGEDLISKIMLRENSCLVFNNNIIESGVKIDLLSSSLVSIGYKTVLGERVKVKSRTSIIIDDFCLIHNNVEINETDCGVVLFDTDYPENKNIHIGTHTLVEQGSIIKGSSYIGDESIIKAYSMVKGRFAPLSVISGNPAQIVDNNKCWKYNF